mmetsp:Transcript_37574/g.55325  ORF Transcript_37574/g.55325 Transcript_37574/m.55325 type:complete len:407 (-) Transcript_37574:188-1408(-)|eukprot:CAMPEP_0195509006 /NCGR_PEP_ID=MMETSP0794_2-20130614/2065_1 /TAXON_ID=515487 /ORGANISM="Stephanopyxis turris, Strain CCMP 815" /LENGTH=406 /DNA_ID=CAMNT_0040636115 /DNA_START=27 /DNA_END=1247 /DNA_ORIENTATION=+
MNNIATAKAITFFFLGLGLVNIAFWKVSLGHYNWKQGRAKCDSKSCSDGMLKWPNRVIYHGSDGNAFSAKLGREVNVNKHDNTKDDKCVMMPKPIEYIPLDKNGTSRDCVPLAEWQTKSYPNCNTFHESDPLEDIVSHLNLGEYRDVWIVQMGGKSFVLKSLRMKQCFSPHRAEQHRLDAMASERLTSSPHVANIYGFCGQSAINELAQASGKLLRSGTLTPKQTLKFASDVAVGVADIHSIDEQIGVTVAHRDIRSPNVLLSKDGKSFIIHDFNCGRFLTWNPKTGSRCAFYKGECNEYRSPEECGEKPLTEKIDVYSMGNVFYVILTSYQPYAYNGALEKDEIKASILNGVTPTLPKRIERSKDPATLAVVEAMRKCLAFKPEDRPSAREVANSLLGVLKSLKA